MEARIKNIKAKIKEINANLRIFEEMEKKQNQACNYKDYVDAVNVQQRAYHDLMDNVSVILENLDLLGRWCGEV